MDHHRFDELCALLIPMVLQSEAGAFTNSIGTQAQATSSLQQDLGPADLPQLSLWAHRQDAELAGSIFRRLDAIGRADALEWEKARQLVDQLTGFEGFEGPLLVLLDWMRTGTPDGSILWEPVVLDDQEIPAADATFNPRLVDDSLDRYTWYWCRYLQAVIDAGRLDEELARLPEGLPPIHLINLSQDSPELSYSVGLLHGALVEHIRLTSTVDDSFKHLLEGLRTGRDLAYRWPALLDKPDFY